MLDEAPKDEGVEVALEDWPYALVISLLAITDIHTEDTMHLHTYIHCHWPFMDSDSIHNFINARVFVA